MDIIFRRAAMVIILRAKFVSCVYKTFAKRKLKYVCNINLVLSLQISRFKGSMYYI